MSKQTAFYEMIWPNNYQNLPPVFRKRYSNRIFSDDQSTVTGTVSVYYSKFFTILSPLFRMMKALVPYSGTDIPVTVTFKSDKNSERMNFNRVFSFSKEKPYQFYSYQLPFNDSIVVEFMRFKTGWSARFVSEDNKIKMYHHGYVIKIFNLIIPLPLNLLMGTCYAEEEAISDTEFKMLLRIKHPLFGEFFGYHGQFKIVEPA